MTRQKSPVEQPMDQGLLFPVDVSREHPAEIGEIVEGGVFPEDLTSTEQSSETRHLHEVIHDRVVAEQKTRRRRDAQLGKHSPLERDGSYLAVRPGDILPGFGIVTYTNEVAAKELAQELESARLAKLAIQPSLVETDQKADIAAAVAKTADALDIKRGLTLPGEPPKDIDVATTQIKLEALRDDDRAGFLPTTHREKTSGHELLDYMIPGKHERGVVTRLDQIFYAQKRDMQQKNGMTAQEAHVVAKDSVRSVVREWGDYYHDAASSWTKLDALQKLTDGIFPNLDIDELMKDQGNGETFAQIVRFNALRQLRDTDKPLGFDPLWVREDRTSPTDEKHKTVEDVFTHKNEEFMTAYVTRRLKTMTAGQIRAGILEAKRDQASRGKFWHGVLESVAENYKYGEYATLALQPVA